MSAEATTKPERPWWVWGAEWLTGWEIQTQAANRAGWPYGFTIARRYTDADGRARVEPIATLHENAGPELANLIRTAPELLAALKDCRARIHSDVCSDDCADDCVAAAKAIAMAESLEVTRG